MGNLFRQYWIPVVPSAHLSEPGGEPLRVKLLGEDLVLFRTHANQVGLIGAYCPHRLAPLYFGRVEAGRPALSLSRLEIFASGKVYRNAQHPARPSSSSTKYEHPGYPCVERGGIIWTYMGLAKDLARAAGSSSFSGSPTTSGYTGCFSRKPIIYKFSKAASIRPTSCGCTRPTISTTKR